MRYEEFWGLTPVSLEDIIYAENEKLKEQMELQDIYNWQLGQYIQAAYSDVLASAFGKRTNSYPKKPAFSRELMQENNVKELSEAQKELETMKFKDFFNNLGKHVKIKNKEGK